MLQGSSGVSILDTWAANSRTVGAWKRVMTLILTAKVLATLAMSRMAIKEWPPSSKKFDVGPISGTRRTSRQIAIIRISASVGSTIGGALGGGRDASIAAKPSMDLGRAILSRTGGTSADNLASGLEIAYSKAAIRNRCSRSAVCLSNKSGLYSIAIRQPCGQWTM